MAKIILRLDNRTTNGNGEQNVRIRISHNGTSTYIPTGVAVQPEYFDCNDLRYPIKRGAYMEFEKNSQIGIMIRKCDSVLFEIKMSDDLNLNSMTANDIREYITGERACVRKRVEKTYSKNRIDFMDWFDKYGQSRETENTRKHYAYVWRLLHAYCVDRGIDRLYFNDIEYNILMDIRKWVLDGRADVTRYKVEAYMHAAYREAQRCKIVSKDCDPYEDFTILKAKRTHPDIDVIELEDLRRFLSLDLRDQQGCDGLSRARDILWTSFCLCGINLTDIYHMKKVHSDEIVYIRRKNRNRVNVRETHAAMLPDVETMVERYAGNDYLFYWQERYSNYYTFQRRINNRCERLSKLNGAKVSMQLIRRTWSTIARQIGVDWHIVNKQLGHLDTEVTDINYARFDWTIAASENRRVVDYVLSGVIPNSVKVPKLLKTK